MQPRRAKTETSSDVTRGETPTGKSSKTVLTSSIALQLGLLGSFGLDSLGVHIPLLRALVGFLFLTFVPGSLLLQILRPRHLGTVDRTLCAVGLSVAFVMFIGLGLNVLLPAAGIDDPFSDSILVPALSLAVLSLLTIAWSRRERTASVS